MKLMLLFIFGRFFILIINDGFACSSSTNKVQFRDKVNADKKGALEAA